MSFDSTLGEYSSTTTFVICNVLIFVFSIYNSFLLYVVWRYIWQERMMVVPWALYLGCSPTSGNQSQQKQQQQRHVDSDLKELVYTNQGSPSSPPISEVELIELHSEQPSSNNNNDHKQVDHKIKWVMSFSTFVCWIICISYIVEALLGSMGYVVFCPNAHYSYLLRIATNASFFSFYSIRIYIMLQDTPYALPTQSFYFWMFMPVTSFSVWSGIYATYMGVRDCPKANVGILLSIGAAIEGFWNIALFSLFYWKLRQITQVSDLSNGFVDDVKKYLNKLFRLFLFTEISAFFVYSVYFIPPCTEFMRMAAAFDLCIVQTCMLFSFKFAQPFYDWLCLCKLQKK